jgi:hypothetical protein
LKLKKYFLEVILVTACILTSTAKAQTILSEDFNRPDGPVGNGWSTWWDSQFEHSNINLVDGELLTHGYPNQAGGVFRSMPVTFPITFSFNFRSPLTVNDNQCTPQTLYNEAGWLIVFNAKTASSLPPYPPNTPAQIMFYQYAGSRNIGRAYLTQNGMVFDSAPNSPEPIANQRDYRITPASHIGGTINNDLSATITIRYNDGQTPDPIIISFGPAAEAVSTPPGTIFVLGNSSCNTGSQMFDNLLVKQKLLAPWDQGQYWVPQTYNMHWGGRFGGNWDEARRAVDFYYAQPQASNVFGTIAQWGRGKNVRAIHSGIAQVVPRQVNECVGKGRPVTQTDLVVTRADGRLKTEYIHLIINPEVIGTQVQAGDIVGWVSDEGCAQLPHLMFIISEDGVPLPLDDPHGVLLDGEVIFSGPQRTRPGGKLGTIYTFTAMPRTPSSP